MNQLAEKFRSNPILFTALFFSAVSCIFFLPVVFQGKLLAPGDAQIQYLPAFYCGTHIWTTQILCGFPWYADPQSMTFYPLKLALSMVPEGWNIFVILSYALAGTFTALYAHSLTRSWTAALIAGNIFAFNGFMLSNFRHTTMVQSAVWLPLGLLAIRRARIDKEEGKPKDALWFSLTVVAVMLMCFGGHPQMFAYGLALLCGYVLAETWKAEKSSRLRFFLLNVLALLLGVGGSAVVILAGAELGSFSWRWNMSYQIFTEYALQWVNLFSLVFPFIFGSFKDSIYGCNYFGAYNLQTVSGYCGLLTFLLCPVGAIAYRKEKVAIFWIVVLTVFFILIFGDVGPLSRIAYQLPCYSRFRIPTRHFFEISMALSALTAYGVAALAQSKISKTMVTRAHAAFIGFFIIIACVAYLIAGASQDRVREIAAGTFGLYPWNNPAMGIPILVFVIATVAYILCASRPKLRWWPLILVFVIDFASVAAGSEYVASSPKNSVVVPPAHAAWLNAEASKTHHRVLSLRGNSGTPDELPVNICMLWGVENASGYENLLPLRISNLLDMKEGGFLLGKWSADENSSLDVLGIKYILLPKNDSRYPAPTSSRWRLVKDAGEALIYENRRTMPRAWLASQAKVRSAEEILKAVKTGKDAEQVFDPKNLALIEGPAKDVSFAKDPNSTVEVQNATPENELTVKTKSSSAGILLTADSFYPGWEASIDGHSTEILKADYVIRGVIVPAGEHTVKFTFMPPRLKLGLLICFISVISTIIVAIVLNQRARKTTSA